MSSLMEFAKTTTTTEKIKKNTTLNAMILFQKEHP